MRLAELRASSGLNVPDCCVLDIALHHQGALATFDRAVAKTARELGITVLR